MNLLPVLQIIHITDLHVKHLASNRAKELSVGRRLAARVENKFKSSPLWVAGTPGHLPKAPESFKRFLQELKKREPGWFGDPEDKDSAQTWLIDTGDLTTFGDEDSIKQGKEYLKTWLEELGGINYR